MSRVLGLDWSAAATHAPGVGRFGRELVRAFVRGAGEGVEVALFEQGRVARLPDAMLGLDGPDVVRTPRVHRVWRISKRVLAPLVNTLGADRIVGGCDVFLRAAPRAPRVARARTAWAVAQWPGQWPKTGDADAAREFERDLAANDVLFVFAECAAQRLVHEFRVARERVHVLPVGADHWLRDAAPQERSNEPRTVVVLGAVEARREPVAVLEAFERVHEKGLAQRLHFVGRRGDAAEDLARAVGFSSVRRDVAWTDEPVEAELPPLVAGAAALVHVASGEATAVTPLEALTFGVPVVVSDTPEMRETLGAFAEYPAPSTPRRRGAAIAEALERALVTSDDSNARALRRAHAAPFTWRACAEAVARVLTGTVSDTDPPRRCRSAESPRGE
jgi:glycosyltransferase involved in cell wall biosynthesis